MFQFLKKASEFIAPTTTENAVEVFQGSCQTVLSTINNNSLTVSFVGALNEVQACLTEEIELDDAPCFSFFVSKSILTKIVDSINESLPQKNVEPIFSFFLSFVGTVLNRYFLQFNVNRPFTIFLAKLNTLDSIDPLETKKFVESLWNIIHPSPVMLEMLNIDGKSFPLFDFLFSSAILQEPSSEFARKIIIDLLNNKNKRTKNDNKKEEVPFIIEDDENKNETIELIEYPQIFYEYIENHFFNKITDFLLSSTETISKNQFHLEFMELYNFIDTVIRLSSSSFSIDSSILQKLESRNPAEKVLTAAFFLSVFSSPHALKTFLSKFQSKTFLSTVNDLLISENEHDIYCAITFLKILFLCNNNIINNDKENVKIQIDLITPSKKGNEDIVGDILSIIPPEWLLQTEGSASLSSYINDAENRLICLSADKEKNNNKKENINDTTNSNNDNNSNNSTIFENLCLLLSKYKSLSIKLFLSLSEVIILLVSISPELSLSPAMSSAFEGAVKGYCDEVKDAVLPTVTKGAAADTPEVRAALLAEFGKEVHATFIASERAKISKARNNDDSLEME